MSDPKSLQNVIETIHRLRAPGGCAWDRAQTHQSLRPFLIEEAYEVLDVLDQISDPTRLKNPGDAQASAFKEELGDLLMQVLLHSEMTRELGAFDIYDVAQGLNEKLIRRHPHVFADAVAATEDTAFASWEKQKALEKSGSDLSILSGLPKGLPALQRAGKVIEKVTKVGFQWKNLEGPLAKVDEELAELKHEIEAVEKVKGTALEAAAREKMASELGDLLFTICNVAFLMKITPEDALRGTLSRFESRFKHVERRLRETGKAPKDSTLEEMDRYWDEAKKLERG